MRISSHVRGFVLAGCCLAIVSTSAEAQSWRRPAPAPVPTVPTVPTVPVPAPAPALTADDMFDQVTVQDVSLTVNTRDWAELREKYRENVYYLADLRWRGEVVRNIGIRSRGMGSRSAAKPGLRLDFDRYSSAQEFLGLKSLVLDNLTQDPSMLKERVMMRFFTEMGIPAPRVVHARLFVNNAFVGLYTIVEPVDKKFLKRHFDQNDGYLYEFKHTDAYGFQYLGTELERYAEFFEPKTNESASMFDLYRPFVDMTWAIAESPDSQFLRVTEPFLDVRTFLAHVAVESFLAEHDGILGEWNMNNFYIYRFEDSTKFQLLPWDKDSSFWDVAQDPWANVDANVLTKRALKDPELRAFYNSVLRRCAELAMRREEVPDPENEGGVVPGTAWLEQLVLQIGDQIRPLAAADTAKPFDNDRFEDELGKVLEFARSRAAIVVNQLDRR